MQDQTLSPKEYHQLLQDCLQILKKPYYEHNMEDHRVIISLLKNVEFFTKKLESPAKLHDFTLQAVEHIHYEVLEYGSVVMREKEYADKFYLVLQGNLQRLFQRPQNDIKQDLNAQKIKKLGVRTHQAIGEADSFEDDPAEDISPKHRSGKKDIKSIFKRAVNLTTKVIKRMKLPESELISGLSPVRIPGLADESLTHSHVESFSPFKLESGASSPSKIDHSAMTPVGSPSKKDSLKKKPSFAGVEYSMDSPKKTFFGSEDSFPKILKGEKPLKVINKFMRSRTVKATIENGKKVGDMSLLEDAETKKERNVFPSPNVPKGDIIFIKDVVAKNPDLDDRLFVEDVVRMTVNKVFEPGDYLGENFAKYRQTKENCIIAVSSSEAHLLTMSRDSYNVIMSELSKWINKKAEIFYLLFPEFNEGFVRDFSYYFSQKHYKKGEIIYSQKDRTKDLYLLYSGDVKLIKETGSSKSNPHPSATTTSAFLKPSSKVEVPLVTVVTNQFFGEEILLGQEKRQLTAVANSPGTIVLVLEEELYQDTQEKYTELYLALTMQAHERSIWRKQRIAELLLKQKATLNTINKPSIDTFNLLNSAKTKSALKGIHSAMLQTSFGAFNEAPSPKLLELSPLKSAHGPAGSMTLNNLVDSTEEDPVKNLEVYKAKYSRKVRAFSKGDFEEKMTMMKDNLAASLGSPQGFFEFSSVKRDPKQKHTERLKFPELMKTPKDRKDMTTRAQHVKYEEPSETNIHVKQLKKIQHHRVKRINHSNVDIQKVVDLESLLSNDLDDVKNDGDKKKNNLHKLLLTLNYNFDRYNMQN